MKMDGLFTSDYKLEPYWWERTPRPSAKDTAPPGEADVAIIGSGYTGLNAALVTARAGRSTVVFDAEDAGYGCSSRNGGQISTSIKPGLAELSRKHDSKTAFNIIKEGHNALEWMQGFVGSEQLSCDFKVPGRFHAAHNSAQFKKLVDSVQHQPEGLEVPCYVVSRPEQQRELGTDVYHGGVVFENHASLDPARYHQELLDRVLTAGASVIPHCPVGKIDRSGRGFIVDTPRGQLHARDVIIATNGYTGSLTPWQRRRVMPIGSYMIATETLEPKLMNRLMPKDRIVSDTRKVVFYYRPSPDRTRIIFGGRVSSSETDTRTSALLLKRNLVQIFPDLKTVRVSHSWMGYVAYTFDTLAHLGKHDGIYYAMGYCGSGVSMASYLGMRVGQKLLGTKAGQTGLDGVNFQTRPLYTGKPWFLAASVAWYRWLDRMNI
jgi:glycine/D-amino acid oxidase-like deaminating enzyme|tara:strand:+ start:377 stop:1678 length:1302 start_codon:yes stop_codon:yes gene_type:complete